MRLLPTSPTEREFFWTRFNHCSTQHIVYHAARDVVLRRSASFEEEAQQWSSDERVTVSLDCTPTRTYIRLNFNHLRCSRHSGQRWRNYVSAAFIRRFVSQYARREVRRGMISFNAIC